MDKRNAKKKSLLLCKKSSFIFYGATLVLLHRLDLSYAQREDKKPASCVDVQVRVRADRVRNQDLGDLAFSPDTHDAQLVSRSRVSMSLKPEDQMGSFFQGQFYSRENHGRYSKANLYQAYLEFFDRDCSFVDFKIGRQELCYGSAFFLGAHDFYDGLVWDGGKLRISFPGGKFWIDLVGVRYVKLSKNTSDNEPSLYGLYSSYTLTKDTDMDAYFFFHKGGFKFFHTDIADSNQWFTLGARASGKISGRIDYEIEPLYQFGQIDNPVRVSSDTISAYGGHVEIGYTAKGRYEPRIFAAYAFGSGDNSDKDKKYEEFHGSIYNDSYLLGDIGLIPDFSGITVGSNRASGMNIIVAGSSIDLTSALNLNLDNHYFVAQKTPRGISKSMGDEVDLTVTYKVSGNCNIRAGADRFFVGEFFKDASGDGKDIDYFYLQTQITF